MVTIKPGITKLLAIGISVLLAIAFASSAFGQDGSRQIKLDEFPDARPAAVATGPVRPHPPVRRATYRRATAKARVNRPTTTGASQPMARTEELGITVWRLRPSLPTDGNARLLVMENARTNQLTPERIEVDTPLKVGERVRITVESPQAGYLYVVDREQYADGSLGDAYLIFPTRRTNGGDNQVRPGKLIDLPAQEDNPNYFTLKPTPPRSDQVAEVLSFIVTSQPIEGLPISAEPLLISRTDIAKWEATWGSDFERFEMEGGQGRTWTPEEKAASARSSSRLLTQEEPQPQTVYRLVAKANGAILVTVPLRYGK